MTDRRRRVLGWGTAVLIAALGWAPAEAHGQTRLSVDDSGGSPSPTCQRIEDSCDEDGDCSSAACSAVPGSDHSRVCTDTSGTDADIYCCGDSVDCRGHGTCTRLDDWGISICVDERELCLANPAFLPKCFVDPDTGDPTSDWSEGDCDGDGTKNGEELEGCVCIMADGCGVTADAGMAIVDAGSDATDAGTDEMKVDAGNRVDASIGSSDAGGVLEDVPQWDFRGSGGCTCDATGAGSSAFWLLLGLAVAAGRALRRRPST